MRQNYKLKARNILSLNFPCAAAVALFCTASRIILLLMSAVFIYLGINLARFTELLYPEYLKHILYILFFAAAVCCLYYFSITGFLGDRWFLGNDGNYKFRDFFVLTDIRLQLKILYLSVYKFLYRSAVFMFFQLPCAVFSAIFLAELRRSAMDIILFIINTIMLITLFLSGIYFSLVMSAKLSFVNALLTEDKSIKLRQLLRTASERSGYCSFRLADFRLSFFMWFLPCILIFPVWFVFPYFRQSDSLIIKTALNGTDR